MSIQSGINKDLRVYVDDVLDSNEGLSRQQLVILASYISRTKKIKPVDALIGLQDGSIPREEIDQLIQFLNEGK